ncbi:MAG: transcription termination/antitermination protein NusG [Candidatus Sumerlaeia bacterium]
MAKKWYAIHTYSSMEDKAKKNIEHMLDVEGYRDEVDEIFIPAESVVEIKEGKKKKVMRNMMPGYIFIHMEPDKELFALVRKASAVVGLVGTEFEAYPVADEEVEHLKELISEKKERPRPKIYYKRGDHVKVVEGPFANFVGTVDTVDEEKAKLTVKVSIFGRETPVELDVLQVESA